MSGISDDHADAFLSRLVAAGSDLGRQLTVDLDTPLRRYLRTVVTPTLPAANQALEYVAHALATYLQRCSGVDGDGVCAQFLASPVIQQADHSALLLDRECFLNNFLFAIGCHETGSPQMITSQCSTVSCLSRRAPVAGPVFLRTRGGTYQVFRFSKRTLKNSNFFALPGPLTTTFHPIERTSASLTNDTFVSRFIGRCFPTAPDAFRVINDEIWRSLALPGLVPRIGVDESMTSELCALHFEDSASPVSTLVFDARVRETFLCIKRRLVASPENLAVNRATPDFFWYRDGTRLVGTVVKASGETPRLVLETDGRPCPVPFTRRALAQALRSGAIYVDRILAYFTRCLLPGVRAVGGTSQQDYVALYQRLFKEVNTEAPFLSATDAQRVDRTDASRLGGAPLLEALRDDAVSTLGPGTPLAALTDGLLDRPLRFTIGTLGSARYLEQSLQRTKQGAR